MRKKGLFLLLFFIAFILSVFSIGNILWKTNIGFTPKALFTLSDQSILICSYKEVTHIDKDGKILKHFQLPEESQGKFFIDNKNNLLFASNKNNLFKISPSGNVIFKKYIKNLLLLGQSNDKNYIYSGIEGTLKSVYGGTIIVNQKIAQIDTNGNIIWTYFIKNGTLEWAFQINDHSIIIGFSAENSNGDANVIILNEEGKLITKLTTTVTKKPLLAKDKMFFIALNKSDYNYYLHAYSITMKKELWKIRLDTAKIHPTYINGKILFIYPEGGMIPSSGSLKIYSENGKLIATRKHFPYTVEQGHVINGHLLWTGFDNLYIIDENYNAIPLSLNINSMFNFYYNDKYLFMINPNTKILTKIAL